MGSCEEPWRPVINQSKVQDFTFFSEQNLKINPKKYSLFTINFLLDKEPRKISTDDFSDEDLIDVESRSASSSSSCSPTSRPSVIKLDELLNIVLEIG